MIEVRGLHKKYGKQEALEEISFVLPKGSVLGVAGANGAGKSTLFDILTTLDRRWDGDVLINGLSPKLDYLKIRKFIGYVPGTWSLYPELTVMENIKFFARMYGCSPDSLFHSPFWDSLRDFANMRSSNLSGGMKQKLAIICAMVHSPEILFLDEPTTGIDPSSREAIWKELLKLRERGVTIVASTHYYEEFNYMESLLFLHEGRQLFFSSVEEIRGGEAANEEFYENYLAKCLKQS